MKILLCVFLTSNVFAFTYKQINNPDGAISSKVIQRIEDTAFIPVDSSNRDYKEFTIWKKNGGKILPPDVSLVDPGKAERDQAILDAKDSTKDPQKRIDALIKVFDLK